MKYTINNIETLYNIYKESTGVTTDSRKATDGKLFFALKGENFDGNEYAQKAIESGAVCAVVNPSSEVALKLAGAADSHFFVVEDTLLALQELANFHRHQFHIPIIGLTGTNGKTTTKELIKTVLSSSYEVLATEGNLNNHIGVPLTLLRLNKSYQIAVVEMGASSPGEIKMLVDIVEPTSGLVTNVGRAHLLGFGSFEGVIKTKGELYDYLVSHFMNIFVNADNQYLNSMLEERGAKENLVHIYGKSIQGVEILEVSAEKPFLRFKISFSDDKGRWEELVETNLIGSYNIDNVLCAIKVGEFFNVSFKEAAHSIYNYYPSNNRSELRKTDKNLLIIDAYNANPTSMTASLNNFFQSNFNNKMVILGDMRELGEDSYKEHLKIIELLKGKNLEKVILVGSEFGKFQSEFDFIFCQDVEKLQEMMKIEPFQNKTILVKGSNGIRLQDILPNL